MSTTLNQYSYSLNECDVKDTGSLIRFREKRNQWIDWLRGDDAHSIWPQIKQMLWNDAIFRMFNEVRRVAIQKPRENIGINFPLTQMVDFGYVAYQTTAIRRLIEVQKNKKDWEVISLRRVINDIKDNLKLLTREIYVSYDGLPYDPEPLRAEFIEQQMARKKAGESTATWIPTQGPKAWDTSYLLHDKFDQLAGMGPENRSRDDRIKAKVLDQLIEKLKPCENIKKYVDKFIAHAAAPDTRLNLTDEQSGITLNQFEECHKIIYQVASIITARILWDNFDEPLPYPYDPFENLTKSMVSKEDLKEIEKTWDAWKQKLDGWETEMYD